MKEVIRINGLSKVFEPNTHALDNVSLSVYRGEIFSLLGPNGAGKTTLIGSVCGIVQPTSGTIEVDGYDALVDYRQARRRIGLVPQELVLDPFETPVAILRYTRGYFGLPDNDALCREVLNRLSLSRVSDRQTRMLSGGMKRRVLIARALVTEPRIIFLDEPTAGVDVELRRDLLDLIRKLREDGVTVILTTHYLEEARSLADRIAFINKGKIVRVAKTREILEQYGDDLETAYREIIMSDVHHER